MSNKSGVASQVLPLPQGGGAISGIGEKFTPDLFTGTGNFSVPIHLPTGRNGLQPQISLMYSSGAGNGPFGLGWSLSVPNITRKTSRGLPVYRDHAPEIANRDTFFLSGAEDLVQISERSPESNAASYRPRTEGLFARIEHVLSKDGETNFWRVATKDGISSLYGTPAEDPADASGGDPRHVIADPAKPSKVFAWMLSETIDPFGNRIEYSYLRDRQRVEERDNGEPHIREWDQLYLERVRYIDLADGRFLASVRFIYDTAERPDAFSSYRSGFEIRTRLRCRRIEIHTDFDGNSPLRTYDLTYLDEATSAEDRPLNGVSLLSRIEVTGHSGQSSEKLPPLEFTYSSFHHEGREFQPLSAETGVLPAKSLADDNHELVDLYGRGLPDLVEMNGAIRFWRNAGDGNFADVRSMEAGPQAVLLSEPGVQFGDLNGNGRSDLLVTERKGYFPLQFAGEFFEQQFVKTELPAFEFERKNTRLLDLDGDGVVDAMRTDADLHVFFNRPDLRRWDAEVRSRGPVDKNLQFEDAKVKLGDLSGDGLQDFVVSGKGPDGRVAVRYWPNIGDGRFAEARVMADGPEIQDSTAPPSLGFEPERLLLTDVDGDGLDDMVYVHLQNTVLQIWINQSGNRWSARPIEIPIPPNLLFESADAIRVEDMLGTGTAGILWTSDRRPGAENNYQYLDLTQGVKPYLLTEMNNNMGAITRVQYAPSTKFYVADEQVGRNWKTPLPFPVQVVERVEVIDELSKGKLTTEYRYQHGYWNGTEREFRGFGLVEQVDTETFERFNAVGLHGSTREFAEVDRVHFCPPTLTKTWFHLGDIDDEALETESDKLPEIDFSNEYFEDDRTLLQRPQDQVAFLKNLPHRLRREALRTLRGSVLRTELSALDGNTRPFTVTETLTGLREVDEPADGESKRNRIFFPHIVGQRNTQWEQGDDPMTRFTFTDDYDEFGQARRRTEIACPRGWRSLDDVPGQPYLATQSRTVFAEPPAGSEIFIRNRIARTTKFELVNNGAQTLSGLKEAANAGDGLIVIGQTLNFYDGAAFAGLPNGELGSHGALVRSENLVLTEEILRAAYTDEDSEASSPAIPPYLDPGAASGSLEEYSREFLEQFRQLPGLAGYSLHAADEIHRQGYFASSERRKFDFHDDTVVRPRGLLIVSRDPLAPDPESQQHGTHDTVIEYDRFDLLPVRVVDSTGLMTTASYDLRVLQPAEVIDVNENRRHFTYSPLGLLRSVAVMGKESESKGDTDEVPGTHFIYDFLAFKNSSPNARSPIFVHTIHHVHHVNDSDVDSEERSKAIETREFSDGFGRLLQTRSLAEDDTAGDSIFGGGLVRTDQSIDPPEIELRTRPSSTPNVVVSGTRVYDNKGRIVETFESYFELETGFAYRAPGNDRFGQKVTMFYDAAGRVARTVSPDGSEQRVIRGAPGSRANPELTNPDIFEPTPWEAYTYDANDLAPLSRATLPDGTPGSPLADKAPRHHHFTPSSILVDALGRTVLAIERNRDAPGDPDDPVGLLPPIQELRTESTYDIRGNVISVTDVLLRPAFRYDYDLANNAVRIRNIDSGTRRMVFDAAGNELERRDTKGALVLRAYDRLQRPTRLWARDDGGPDKIPTLRERLDYGDGSDPGQDITERAESRARNRLGVIHRHYDEAGMVEFREYDFRGNILEKSRRVIRDQVIARVFPDSGDPAPNWNIRAFRVDWEPLPEKDQELLAEGSHDTSTTYDALNRIKSQLYPRDVEGGRRQFRPAFNRAGALESVALDGQPVIRHVAYNAKGQRTFAALGNDVMILYEYHAQTFRLARMFTTRYTQPGDRKFRPRPLASPEDRKANLHQDFGYDYDLVGNVTRIHDRTPNSGIIDSLLGRHALDRAFEYDAIYRLIGATGRESERADRETAGEPFDPRPHGADLNKTHAYRERYQYDRAGNLEELSHAASGPRAGSGFLRKFEHRPEKNQLANMESAGIPFKFVYDANGNMTDEGTSRHFEWDHQDRMKVFRNQVPASGAENGTQLAEPTVYTQYFYDSAGLRVKKVVRKQGGSMEVTEYVDGTFELHRGSGIENNTIHIADVHTRVATERVGSPFSDDNSPSVKYHLGDHLGGSNVVSDIDGVLVNREEYTPYGETTFGSFAKKRYRFTGMERDDESGLSYHRARYYATWLARWTTADPIGLEGGNNPYQYCRGDPIANADTSGQDEWCFTPGCGEFAPLEFTGEKIVPRVVGAGKVAAGAAGFAVGFALCETGIGCAAGGPLMIVSADVAGAGLGEAIFNEPQTTVAGQVGGPTVQAIEEGIVDAAGWSSLVAEGFLMWSQGTMHAASAPPRGAAPAPSATSAVETAVKSEKAVPARGSVNGVPANTASGEFVAAKPLKRRGGTHRLVNPTRDAKSWPSRTVRIHRSVDPGRRLAPTAAGKRAIRQRPAADPEGPYDFGHKPGHEAWREQRRVRAGEISREEFIRGQQNPDIYQLENRRINRGHLREKK